MILVALALLACVGAFIGASMGLFTGKRPAGLGFADGRFKTPPAWTPNWVSSTVAQDDKHYIAPFDAGSDRAKAWAALGAAIESTPGATIVRRDPGYLHVEFASSVMGFVDDGEFQVDPGGKVIHVRSAARLGVRDFDVNRKRVERLRGALPRG
ncbi:hypothetical protein BWI17_09310 [Betaproteobacteria bacterium GR16-43]|nr:hypothetical protein BWI17_09310 [Betaproteobacteria bacterium GR16-43]